MKRLVVSLAATMTMSIVGIAQESNEDVILTTDGRVLRGAVIETMFRGTTVTLTPAEGRPYLIFMSEIAAVRRFPRGIPDSVIAGSFDSRTRTDKQGRSTRVYDAPRNGPKCETTGYENEEDVLFLADGSVLRGVILNLRNDGVYSTWISGAWKNIGRATVVTSARVAQEIPDSTLVHTHVNVPEAWRDGERRVLSVDGGFSIPICGLAAPIQKGRSAARLGRALGLEAGIRLWPGIRLRASAKFSEHPRDVPVLFIDASVHPVGTATIEAISSSSFGFAVGSGLLAGKFSLDFAWTYFRPEYESTTRLRYDSGYASVISSSAAEASGFITLSVGYSMF